MKQNNYGSIDEVSFSVNAELKPAKWWTLLPYAEFNYNKVNSTLNGFNLKTTGSGLTGNINNQFKFKKGWGAEISGFYRTKMKQGQFEINPLKQFNAGVSKQVLKGKGSVKVNVSDIFYTNKQSGTVNIENTIAKFRQVNDSRYASINFSYRFGKPLKTQRRKTGGAGDEQNRIKTN